MNNKTEALWEKLKNSPSPKTIRTFAAVILLMVIVLAYEQFTALRTEAILSSQEYDMSQIELNITRDECNELQEHVNELQCELDQSHALFESQIETMRQEVEKVSAELSYYKDREQWYRNIDLSDKYQKFTYEMCEELELDYDLALAKFKLESQFKLDARGYNRDSEGNITSIDYGIGQVNSGNIEWVDELCGREVDVVNDVYDNIESSLRIYKHYRDYWLSKGYSGKELEIRALNTYNRGVNGFLSYMSQGNNYNDWYYAKLVYSNLDQIN